MWCNQPKGSSIMATLRGAAVSPWLKLLGAFLAVYVIWGSTYLAISYADRAVPPFLMAGTRFFVAGALLYVWARLRGAARPTGVNQRWQLV
jgi:drug/metabolite transporter (DMT)-like permease